MASHAEDDLVPEDTGYRPPVHKSVNEILNTDAEDESLRKYKEALLGTALSGGPIEVCQ